MKIYRLAKLYTAKYKFAHNLHNLEQSIRKKISILWNYPHKLFPILQACAQAGVSKPKGDYEKSVVAGYKFCKNLLEYIDYLKEHQDSLSLNDIKTGLESIVDLINKENISSSTLVPVQFPNVSNLIFELIPISKKHDVKLKNEQYSKAKTGITRILGLSIDLIKELKELPVELDSELEDVSTESPSANYISPQRAPLSEYDIIDFIRQHGEEYNIPSRDTWDLIFMDNPTLKQEMTTVINALNRGHVPINQDLVKMQINDILLQHKQHKS